MKNDESKCDATKDVFAFGGKVLTHAAERALVGWDSYKLFFPSYQDWEDTQITVSSAWGEGNNGRDLWGWTGGAAVSHGEVKKEGDRYYFIYSLQSDVGQSREIVATFRVVRRGGHYVFSASFPY